MTSLEKTDGVLRQVKKRREKQNEKWGQSSHPLPFWLTILVEEVGEVSEAILAGNTEEVKDELLDVSAVAVAIIEDIQ